MKLIIVESPTKAKTLKKYLGRDFQVEASMGHIRDLPKSKLAVDVANDFEPEYIQVRGKSQLVQKLKKLAGEAEKVYLAMDPDREGEAIAWHTQALLTTAKGKSTTTKKQKTAKKSEVGSDRFVRVTFHEVTKAAVLKALEKPGVVNLARVDAQQARRVLDRLVGYKLSPLLWKKVRRGLSAGRVQSVALRMIVEREQEILDYKSQEYWDVACLLDTTENSGKVVSNVKVGELTNELMPEPTQILASLVDVGGKKIIVVDPKKIDANSTKSKKDDLNTIQISSKDQVKPIIEDLQKAKYQVKGIETKERKRYAKPPLTTSTLQQAAASRFGWSGKQTMTVAQQLFEAGYITYHRTDSVSLSAEAVSAVRDYIENTFGKDYLPGQAIAYRNKSKNAQEAHEAIRPTTIATKVLGSQTQSEVDVKQQKLYSLIWQRVVASQMNAAVYDQTTVDIGASVDKLDNPGSYKYGLRAVGSVIKFPGWLKVVESYSEKRVGKSNDGNQDDVLMPEVKANQELFLNQIAAEQKSTQPPPRFNDASLVKELEKRGIGRPSTYASIIGVLADRGYVERIEKRFHPTDIGKVVVDFLKQHFEEVMDLDFTAQMEDKLDSVATGDSQWRKVIGDFYKPFEKKLEKVDVEATRMEVPIEKTGETCPNCKEGEIIIRSGRFGKFYACDKYPECKYTKQYVEALENFSCPECGKEVVVKRTRRGKPFYGCSGYPECNWASWKDPRPSVSADNAE